MFVPKETKNKRNEEQSQLPQIQSEQKAVGQKSTEQKKEGWTGKELPELSSVNQTVAVPETTYDPAKTKVTSSIGEDGREILTVQEIGSQTRIRLYIQLGLSSGEIGAEGEVGPIKAGFTPSPGGGGEGEFALYIDYYSGEPNHIGCGLEIVSKTIFSKMQGTVADVKGKSEKLKEVVFDLSTSHGTEITKEDAAKTVDTISNWFGEHSVTTSNGQETTQDKFEFAINIEAGIWLVGADTKLAVEIQNVPLVYAPVTYVVIPAAQLAQVPASPAGSYSYTWTPNTIPIAQVTPAVVNTPSGGAVAIQTNLIPLNLNLATDKAKYDEFKRIENQQKTSK